MAEGHLIDPLHQPLKLLKPGRGVLAARSGAADGDYAFFVEYIVLSKTVADVLEKRVEVGDLQERGFGAWHFGRYGSF
jgi:hypothetical protein